MLSKSRFPRALRKDDEGPDAARGHADGRTNETRAHVLARAHTGTRARDDRSRMRGECHIHKLPICARCRTSPCAALRAETSPPFHSRLSSFACLRSSRFARPHSPPHAPATPPQLLHTRPPHSPARFLRTR
eukprot:776587-Prymnesium_polylepis.1